MFRSFIVFTFMICAGVVRADGVTVAVAANLLPTAQNLAAAHGGDIRIAHGSTGRLYAQIRAGAPFDIFLAADVARPARLEDEGFTAARRTYALGRLVLVATDEILDGDLPQTLIGRRLAIADAALAPYGLAAEQALAQLGVDLAKTTLITGDSIGQVAGFAATGNVDAAMIALSLLPQVLEQRAMAHHNISDALHDPIRQDAVLLLRGAKSNAARSFWDWLQTPAATAILEAAGYTVPAP
ncbi:molybdate ABC transporter substrate-binding protein [Oceaniglobus ichthyenteri]|uniref:molybdate ABC transporter substrate-binding protein n=1 Tax=Oceaniglobus ichthyenteri TaxID=2136177 RepID=UPI0013DDDF92|nr:molybdate ABC transporter substrate-binding protein [Oceaniglobus ichthyenteri]